MDEAWHPQLKRHVLADELWEIEKPKEQPWQCHTCRQELQAVACDLTRRHEFKVRPYFRATTTHPCDKKIEDLIQRGQTRSVLQEQNLPIPIYSELQLDNSFEKVVDGSPRDEVTRVKDQYRRTSAALSAPTHPHSKIATSIRPLCAQYINFPHDRRHSLVVPGVPGTTYWEAFQPMRFFKPTHNFFSTPRIFIGEIFFKAAPQRDAKGEALTITLNERRRNQNSPASQSDAPQYHLHIDMAQWTRQAKTALLEDINCAREEALEAFKQKSSRRSWIFFLGRQDANDPLLFHVDDKRLVCCFTKEIIWPSPKAFVAIHPTRYHK